MAAGSATRKPAPSKSQAAQALGIEDGAPVRVESPYGGVRANAHVTEQIHPEVVGLQHGFGYWAMGTQAKGAGCSDAALRPTKADPIAEKGIHEPCCVRVVRV